MRIALLCGAALISAPALADELVARNGSDQIRLSDSPCKNEQVLARIKPAYREQLRDANAVVEGQSFKACWIANGEIAHVLYEDGDQGLIPLSDFKPPASA
ncbi:MAG: hypothetical protein ACAH21_02155 [Ramlibacter sp.]